MMTAPTIHAAQREADAAYFEDWSEWISLDGRPVRPIEAAHWDSSRRPSAPAGGWARYWCLPPDRGSEKFWLHVGPGEDLIRRLPGAKPIRRHRYDQTPGYWSVPAASWRSLRAILPRIKQMTIAKEQESARREASHRAEAVAVAARRIAEAASGDRDLAGIIDAVGNAVALRAPELTAWERRFAADICDRWLAAGGSMRLSDKQRAVLDRIHDKIRHRVLV
ncbi:hypothetical protein [Enterovirga aerilata]|uniref:Uncharacterized protein n=1 Tax=Enterovirga aerilata TaxID=2730920 RepID=A0A849I5F1_9HYPH|nr:hypothetical protein [Enterovirga sp. DB1703]NNM75086.1 hypothetical protein [Enterovirga sp. DB1703]